MPTETIQHHRWAPPEFLEDFIAHYWSVAWTLAEPHTAETIPHPCTHIILDQDEQTPLLQAVRSDVFTRTLEGSGAVLGVKFRPAMGFSLTRQPQNTRRNSSVSLHSILPELPRDLVQRRPLARSLPALEDALRRSLHPIESGQAALRDLLEGVASRPTHFTAASLAHASGVSLRTLQRQCARFVGLSPKQIILRYRLIETAETLRRQPENLAAVAADLEYADQAHLTHTFRSFTGHTPSGFVEAAQSDQTPSPSD